MTPFLILAMPRSRSYWVSRFLSYDGIEVEHDPSRFFRGHGDLRDFFIQGRCGVDTALGYIWPTPEPLPARVASLSRPLGDVYNSLRRLREPFDETRLELLYDILGSVRGAQFTYLGLETEAECRRLFEWALRKPFDRDWWLSMKDQNLQCDRKQYLVDVIRNSEGLMNLYGGRRPA